MFAGVGPRAPLPPPNVSVTLYAGSNFFKLCTGLDNSANNITSPGPTLTFKVGDVVNMTVVNVGTMPHNWALTTDQCKQSSAKSTVFGAQNRQRLSPHRNEPKRISCF